ncbi:prophage antirepressor-like protein [Vibrio diazotrophicus]|uniref:Prophage antirepressor-like protein n=1 Tax=Vibrio diazotrophicus TaxID=685 RepID=A0A329E5J8_VIBDI|nr:BRO family protein [Vibrio diazotrophicus]RAS60072.1 prophage antirepressor-like protein [Vibrio diazotrophicus]
MKVEDNQLQLDSVNSTSLTEVFSNPLFGDLTVLTDNAGLPWFFANDVASSLGYKNARDAIRKHVDSEDKSVANRDTLGGDQQVTTINESGLYALIFSSKLPNAKAFKRWVTTEVLPSIRKHGGYTHGQSELSPEELMAKALLVAQSAIQEKELENARLSSAIEDLSAQLATGVTIPSFCMQLNGVNTQDVQSSLASIGVLIAEKHGFRPSSAYRNTSFTCSSYEYQPGKRSYKTLVTPKGAEFLYRLYRKDKLPMRKDWNGSYTTSQLTQEQLKSLH